MRDDDDDEFEESYVMVELSGIVDTDYFTRADAPFCRIWGLDGPQPILQLDRFFFVGGFEDIVGTALLFDQADAEEVDEDTNGAGETGASPAKMAKDIFTTFTSEAYQRSANLFNMTTSHLDRDGSPATDVKKLKLFGHTFKKLSMHRAFLNKKRAETADSGETAEETDGIEGTDEEKREEDERTS